MTPQFRAMLALLFIIALVITCSGCSLKVESTCTETTKVTKVSTPIASAGGTIYQVGVMQEVIQTCNNLRRPDNG